jgi:hypothetical protein
MNAESPNLMNCAKPFPATELPWKDYLQKRAFEVAPIYERSGAKSWVEFCMRFARGVSLVRATVGSTSQSSRLADFAALGSSELEPLPDDVQRDMFTLQYRWSDEADTAAEPWSM